MQLFQLDKEGGCAALLVIPFSLAIATLAKLRQGIVGLAAGGGMEHIDPSAVYHQAKQDEEASVLSWIRFSRPLGRVRALLRGFR